MNVGFYFDFISPYSWLALMQAERFAAEHGVRWRLEPVVYAALLDHWGLVGPAETDAKRRYTFRDVVRCADELGLRLTGPPRHPFRSLEALRTAWAFREDPAALCLVVGLADACWGEGRPLDDPDVVADVVRAAGLDATGLAGRIGRPEIKSGLRDCTAAAIERDVFGVPTFELGGELFWGHDRLGQLARRLGGELAGPDGRGERLAARPPAVTRRRG